MYLITANIVDRNGKNFNIDIETISDKQATEARIVLLKKHVKLLNLDYQIYISYSTLL